MAITSGWISHNNFSRSSLYLVVALVCQATTKCVSGQFRDHS